VSSAPPRAAYKVNTLGDAGRGRRAARHIQGRQGFDGRGERGFGDLYSINAMTWGTVELEPEVRDWLENLSAGQFARALFYIDLLADQGPLLDEPYTRQLDGRLRELRFHLDRAAIRITYWMTGERRIILLTVFHKTQMREDREIARARRALKLCIDEGHTVDEEE
jgi:phage-related protein